MRFADLDAVTIDAFGTLVDLIDPVPALQESLAVRGLDRSPGEVRDALGAELTYYRAHVREGRDLESLASLRVRCTKVFLDALDAELQPEQFAPTYIGSLRFRALARVRESLRSLRARGLELAVVANWDIGLREHLDENGLGQFFSIVEPLAGKPESAGLARALRALQVEPSRALHIGDEESDETAAAAVGARYLPAPLPAALAQLG
jgi:putative hydrolase of the HAD superfamily